MPDQPRLWYDKGPKLHISKVIADIAFHAVYPWNVPPKDRTRIVLEGFEELEKEIAKWKEALNNPETVDI